MRNEFALACALLSGLLCYAAPAAQVSSSPQAKTPLLVVLNGDQKQWEPICKNLGWQLLTPTITNTIWTDKGTQSLEAAVRESMNRPGVDDTQVYLIGQGPEAPLVFFLASRVPELWAAALAVGGTVRPAVDSNRLFGANTKHVPVLWVSDNKWDAPLVQKLKTADFNFEIRKQATEQEVFAWLAEHRRDPLPTAVDCETSSPAFAGCYWIQMTKFDQAERNDVLPSTRVPAGSRASLDLGGFGFNPDAPGPGVLVGWLPPNYKGPLKLNDRIVELGGKPIADGHEFVQLMDQVTDQKSVAVMIHQGSKRIRIETKIVIPIPPQTFTARVQGSYLPGLQQIQILSRSVTQMRLMIPQDWAPAVINWNGAELVKAQSGGCWLLNVKSAVLSAQKCP